jgi:hypothetical protein
MGVRFLFEILSLALKVFILTKSIFSNHVLAFSISKKDIIRAPEASFFSKWGAPEFPIFSLFQKYGLICPNVT